MADVNVNPFEEHGRTEESMGEDISLTPVEGGSTKEPEREQET